MLTMERDDPPLGKRVGKEESCFLKDVPDEPDRRRNH
jgi:hypothetical protein